MENRQEHRWVFLSYEVNSKLSSYGNGERAKTESVNSIPNGNSSNTSKLIINSHCGTHIDFPFHFSERGKNGSSFRCDDYIFERVQIIDISSEDVDEYIINKENLKIEGLDTRTEFLLIKTGFGSIRNSETYWKNNWGFSPETADYLKSNFPNLRAVGFDLISLSSFQKREIGRIAHKKFLIENNILVIEDMDLEGVNFSTQFEQLIVSPIRFENADGAPVTILAKVI